MQAKSLNKVDCPIAKRCAFHDMHFAGPLAERDLIICQCQGFALSVLSNLASQTSGKSHVTNKIDFLLSATCE